MRRSRDLRDAQEPRSRRDPARGDRAATLTVAARAGANGRLFGSVTEADIVNALRTATGISLDRHAIHMAEHLKEVGTATVTATLFDGVERHAQRGGRGQVARRSRPSSRRRGERPGVRALCDSRL